MCAGFFCLYSCNTRQPGYRLEGELTGFAEGSKISITLASTHRDEKPEAETTLQGNRFTLTGHLPEPRLYYLRIEEPSGAQGGFRLMLENSKIQVKAGKGQNSSPGYFNMADYEVKGSESDELFRRKMAFRDKLDQWYQDNHKKHQPICDRISAARKSGDSRLLDSLTHSPAYQELEKDEHAFFEGVGKAINAAITADGDSFWGPLLMLTNYNYFMPNDTSAQNVYNRFSPAAQNSYYGQILKKQLFTESLKGKPLPSFTLPDRNGKASASEALRKGKKCVLIDFWASWCGPCRKSIPALKEIYKDFSEKGLEIVSISIDKRKADWDKALDEEQLPWPCLLDTAGVFKEKFDGRAIPAFFIVDATGTVTGERLEVNELRQTIEAQLSE